MTGGLLSRKFFTKSLLLTFSFLLSVSVSFASGTITYVDSNGLNPRSSPSYAGGYTIETFTSSGTFTTPTGVTSADVLIVAGGGGGTVYYSASYTGGGGGGGLLYGTLTGLSGSYSVTVGSGGVGSNGGNSTFGVHTALGGGYATGLYQGGASSGGSGGGSCCASSYSGTAGAAATQGNSSPLTGYGNAGGAGHAIDGVGAWGGGGGGAGGAGGAASYPAGAGSGGAGRAYNISGATTTYAAGGYTGSGAGTANTGNGGGAGQNGGSGIVIVKYLSIDPNLPTVASATSTYITTTSAVLGATIESIGGSSITDRGICYGVSASSTTCTSEGSVGTGSYSLQISGLATSTSYYYYAYAVNSYGTSTTVGAYFTTEGLTNSLMFDSAQSQYLSRTFGTATDGKKWTYSFWVKRSMLYAQNNIQYVLATAGSGAQGVVGFGLANNADEISFTYGGYVRRYTSMQFRDPSAWQHVVLKVDTTATAEADRAIFYVNGVQASMVTPTTISQNDTTQINQAVSTLIGNQTGQPYGRFDGYLSDINFVDGQALTPSYFGKSDSNTGNWIPKAYQGTYGVNGFHLTFSSSTSLGLDTSGNGNTWTVNGGITSANNQVIDTPLNNFTVLNVLDKNFSQVSAIKKGNLYFDDTASGGLDVINGSFGVKTGKWYWEVTMNNVGSTPNASAGLSKIQEVGRSAGGGLGSVVGELGYIPSGSKVVDGVTTSYGASFTNGDIIGVAYDADAGSVTFYKNNSSQGSISYSADSLVFPSVGKVGNYGAIQTLNFGQKSFIYTPPTGYKSLSTANLPTPTILKPNQHFDVATRTGTAAGYVKSGVMFQPDLIWSKGRNGATNHYLQDIARGFGASKSLSSNTTGYEAYNGGAPSLHSFNPTVDGYTLNANDSDNNANGTTYVDWLWKGGNATTTNMSGTITSVVSTNPTSGFSVISYTGNGGAGATIGHGLNSKPDMYIVKRRDSAADWIVYHSYLGGDRYIAFLNRSDYSRYDNGTAYMSAATSTIKLDAYTTNTNALNGTYITYAFTEVPGSSKFGTYIGNGAVDGPFVYTGFKPKYVMLKRTDSAYHWYVWDSVRDTYNPFTHELLPSSAAAEYVNSPEIDSLSNGFKLRGTFADLNASGGNYIYAAFAESIMIPTLTTIPSVTTPTATSTTNTTVTLGGTITGSGDSTITARGVCYGTTPAPTSCTAGTGTSTGVFTVDITGLATSTTYYYRAYATNSYGTAYSTDSTFTTEGLTNSLILDSTQSQYLSRTPSVSGNQQKWTWSGWVKRGKLGTGVDIFSAKLTGASYPNTAIAFDNTDAIRVWSYTGSSFKINKYTSALFRDPSTWMHIAVAVDSTDVTAEDRVKLYINGTRVTSFSTNTNPSQNDTFDVNVSGNNHVVGGWGAGSYGYFDGYITDVNFVDGQQLTPSQFGRSDGNTGNWIPKKYSGTYGVNGFHLQFNNAGLLGADTSGNGNHWSLNGGITASNNQVIDTPLNNFATLNPVFPLSSVLSKGSLTHLTTTNNRGNVSSIEIPSSGKWYAEFTAVYPGGAYDLMVGLNTQNANLQDVYRGGYTTSWSYNAYGGEKYLDGVMSSYGSTFTTNDIIGVAVDRDANTLTFYKNNVSQGVIPSLPSSKVYFWVGTGGGVSSIGGSWNFGQKPFAYTPPSGFKTLSTANLSTPTILKPNKHFDVVTYTGNNTGQAISGLNFKPDLIWAKDRSVSRYSNVIDSVRGLTKYLNTELTNAEGSVTSGSSGKVLSINNSGYVLGSDQDTSTGAINYSTDNYVNWLWKAGNATTTNTAGSITSTVSTNLTAGFSIVTYNGASSGNGDNKTVGHGLGTVPKFVMVKARSGGAENWYTWHSDLPGGTYWMALNQLATPTNDSTRFFATPTATVLNLGGNSGVSASGYSYVAYVWSEVSGYSKFGSYTGNGSTDGPFIYTGFKPKFILLKSKSGAAASWLMHDTVRDTYNPLYDPLFTEGSAYESGGFAVDSLSNGFKIRHTASGYNTSGDTYIYAAFAESIMLPTVPALPTVTTPTATSTTETEVVLGGTIESSGGGTITARGTCYGITPAPTTNCAPDGATSTGVFTQSRTGLATSTTYYYRAYATNAVGTSYSADGTFTTEGLTNSLMLDSSQSQYLSRTPSVSGNQQKWTWSGWVKRGKLGTGVDIFSAKLTGASYPNTAIAFDTTDAIRVWSYTGSSFKINKYTSALFRDPSAWMNITVAVDSTDATAEDRVKIYINGVRLTSFSTNTNPSQNDSFDVNVSGNNHVVGGWGAGSYGYFDGYLSDVYFLDGQALTPSYFGKSDDNTGNWIPKKYNGTYGNNGFHLQFNNASNLGADTSGNTNHWSLNGGITASNNQVIDTPLNNFATLSGIDKVSGTVISKASLGFDTTPPSGYGMIRGGVGVSSGKWWWEVSVSSLSTSDAGLIGIASPELAMTSANWGSYGYGSAGQTLPIGNLYGTSYSAGDVVGVALDMDNGTLTFYKQTGGTGPFVSQGVAWSGLSGYYIPIVSDARGTVGYGMTGSINFGQKAFKNTSLPEGYKALSTANLPVPNILKPNRHFDVVTYTGSGSSQSITGLNFKPGLVWIKDRNTAASSNILDSVRGERKHFESDTTNAETTESSGAGLTSFNNDGFSLGTENAGPGRVNSSANTFVAWNWKGGNATTTNTSGSITSTVSVNQAAGFSISKFILNVANGASISWGHGLSTPPKMVIYKRANTADSWLVYHANTDTSPNNYYLTLQTSSAKSNVNGWASSTATTMTGINNWQNGDTVVAYSFAEVPGYSKFGSYTGNGSADGPFVYTGFKPRYIMTKRIDGGAEHWNIFDTSRAGYNSANYLLYANLANADDTTNGRIDILSNGFKARDNGSGYNASGATYIYAAFAESIMIPTAATSTIPTGIENVTVTPDSGQSVINYTIPASPNFSQVVVLRSNSSGATDAPINGTTYSAGDIIGSSVVACVDSTITASTFDSCTATGLSNGVVYYFKVFTKINGNYTEVSTVQGSTVTPNVGVVSLSTEFFRLRNDDGDEVTATYGNGENNALSSGFLSGDKKRIRFVVSNQTSSLTSKRYQLEYSSNSCTSWTVLPIPTALTNQHFRMEGSKYLTDNALTTHSSGMSVPSGKTFAPGRVQTFNNVTNPIVLNSGEYTEIEYVIRATNNIVPGVPYCFRLTGYGDTSGFVYSSTPQITSASIVYRRQGGGGGGWTGSIINVEAPVVVASTTTTGGIKDGTVISTSTTVEATTTPAVQQSTTTPTRRRGGGGDSGSIQIKNEYALGGVKDTINFINLFIKELVNYQIEKEAIHGYAMQECNLKSLVLIKTGECEHLELYGEKKPFNLNMLWSVFDKIEEIAK